MLNNNLKKPYPSAIKRRSWNSFFQSKSVWLKFILSREKGKSPRRTGVHSEKIKR